MVRLSRPRNAASRLSQIPLPWVEPALVTVAFLSLLKLGCLGGGAPSQGAAVVGSRGPPQNRILVFETVEVGKVDP
jgi:hypothetical protein